MNWYCLVLIIAYRENDVYYYTGDTIDGSGGTTFPSGTGWEDSHTSRSPGEAH